MSKIKEFFRSPHIKIALATGFSIIVMAIFSKRILPEPISYLSLAIPPFIATIFELLLEKHKDSKFLNPLYWVLAILLSTVIVIYFHS
jgi:predicted histidine transporter YuiF (NhaC family)